MRFNRTCCFKQWTLSLIYCFPQRVTIEMWCFISQLPMHSLFFFLSSVLRKSECLRCINKLSFSALARKESITFLLSASDETEQRGCAGSNNKTQIEEWLPFLNLRSWEGLFIHTTSTVIDAGIYIYCPLIHNSIPLFCKIK